MARRLRLAVDDAMRLPARRCQDVRLTPRETERLLLFQAAELARRRRGRGLRLNQAEAIALIADEVCEAARDGLGYEAVVAGGYRVLGPADVLDGVPALVPRIEVEALFGDGCGSSSCTIRSRGGTRLWRCRPSRRSSGSRAHSGRSGCATPPRSRSG